MVLGEYIANDYLRALVIFVGLILVLKIFVLSFGVIILKFVKKTKTKFDDEIVSKTSVPITMILVLISMKIAIDELAITGILMENINAIVYSAAVVFVAWLIYVIVDIVIFNAWTELTKRANMEVGKSLASLIHGVLKIVLVILALLYILDIWGFKITPLLAGLGLAGLAVALALQPVLGNIFAGVSIISDKTVRIGDLVYLDAKTKGKIEKIGLRSTKIRTFDNELIIVPNSKLAESIIQNVTLPEPKTRVVVQFGVAYGSNIKQVKEVVLKEIESIGYACKDPAPLVRFLEMGDSSLKFKVYFHVDSYEDRFASIDEATTKIYNALNKNNIEIPFPQVDVHLKKE